MWKVNAMVRKIRLRRSTAIAALLYIASSTGCGDSTQIVGFGDASSPVSNIQVTGRPGGVVLPTPPVNPTPRVTPTVAPEQPTSIKPSIPAVLGACEPERFLDLDLFDSAQTPETTPPVELRRVSGTASNPGGRGGFPELEAYAQSADGSTIAFITDAKNLAHQATSRAYLTESRYERFLYVRDVRSGTTRMIDVNTKSDYGYQTSMGDISLSADGRYLMVGTAISLVPQDTNTEWDYYRIDLQDDSAQLAAVGPSGQAVGDIFAVDRPWLSPDGTQVVYGYRLNRFTNQIIHYHLGTRTRTVLGNGYLDNGHSSSAVSADGTKIVYTDSATIGVISQVYLLDRTTGESRLLSKTDLYPEANGTTNTARISADGKYVVFRSHATNLVPGGGVSEGYALYGCDLATGEIEQLNIRSDGGLPISVPDGEFWTLDFGLSGDGRFVVFSSIADGLVTGDTNGKVDLFLRDRQLGTTTLASVNSTGEPQTGRVDHRFDEYTTSYVTGEPAISQDGRYILYGSDADNLVPNDVNAGPDVFRFDREARIVTLQSVRTDGEQMFASGDSLYPILNADGRIIAFRSFADQLMDIPTELLSRFYEGLAYVRDMDSDSIETLLVTNTGAPFQDLAETPPDNGHESSLGAFPYSISDDGQVVLFSTPERLTESDEASNINVIPGISNVDAYLYWVADKVTSLLSGGPTAKNSDPTWGTSLSRDGQLVALMSRSVELDPNDTDPSPDIYLRDRRTGQLQLQTTGPDGKPLGLCSNGKLSGDGKHLAFETVSSQLDAEGRYLEDEEIFIRDIATGVCCRVTRTTDGEPVNGWTALPEGNAVSNEGRYVSFESYASNLYDNDTNGVSDVFLYDRTTTRPIVVSRGYGGTLANGRSLAGGLSGDGRYVVFISHASNIVPNDSNGVSDAFVYDQLTGQVALVSRTEAGTQTNGPSDEVSISRDGRVIAFSTRATNLDPTDDNMVADVYRVRNPLSR